MIIYAFSFTESIHADDACLSISCLHSHLSTSKFDID